MHILNCLSVVLCAAVEAAGWYREVVEEGKREGERRDEEGGSQQPVLPGLIWTPSLASDLKTSLTQTTS